MKIRFSNSANVRAPERFVLRAGRWSWIDIPVRYGVFDHIIEGRGLIDTGYSNRIKTGKRSLALKIYNALLGPSLETVTLPEARPNVDMILITHLHADHISALRDYPNAKLYADRAAVLRWLDKPNFSQVRHGLFAELLPDDFLERLIGFEDLPQVAAPFGLGQAADVFGDQSILAVPLPGHMDGHTGFVWTDDGHIYLYAADAEWMKRAVTEDRSPGFPGSMVADSPEDARQTAERLRAFTSAGGELVLCHDPEPL